MIFTRFIYRAPISREKLDLLPTTQWMRAQTALIFRRHPFAEAMFEAQDEGVGWINPDPIHFDPVPLEKYFDQHLEHAKFYASAFGWDGTGLEIKCFVVPTFDQACYGFVIPQISNNNTFVVSPIELPEFEHRCDFDAKTNTDELDDIQNQMEGGPKAKRIIDPKTTTGWATSKAGNLYRKINGISAVVMPSKRGLGYISMLASDTGYKVFSPTFATETQACRYVTDNFFEMMDKWPTVK